jgi:hypothetical protein
LLNTILSHRAIVEVVIFLKVLNEMKLSTLSDASSFRNIILDCFYGAYLWLISRNIDRKMYVKILLYLIFLLGGDRVGGKGVCGRLMSPAQETQSMREIRQLKIVINRCANRSWTTFDAEENFLFRSNVQ